MEIFTLPDPHLHSEANIRISEVRSIEKFLLNCYVVAHWYILPHFNKHTENDARFIIK